MTDTIKLRAIHKLEGHIELITGLRIGGSDAEMRIGGLDNPILKHPHNGRPYIPGSSIKGKTRALLELASGLMHKTKGGVLSYSSLNGENEKLKKFASGILRVFGTGGSELNTELGPTRASFSDAVLDPEWLDTAMNRMWPLTEVKTENDVNRIRGSAENLRHTERIPAGAKFHFFITFKEMMEGDSSLIKDVLLFGLKLLESDTLGGNGSRGYGRIKIEFKEEININEQEKKKLHEVFEGININEMFKALE